MANDILGGAEWGLRMGEQGRAVGQQMRLAKLAPQIMSGDLGAFEQAAAINPQAAQAYQTAADASAKRIRGAAKYMHAAVQSNNPQQIAGAWQTVRPYLERTLGKPMPAAYDPSSNQALEQLLAKTAYLDEQEAGGVHSAFRGQNGNMWVLDKNGQARDTGAKFDPNTQIIEGAGGFYGVNKSNLTAAPVQIGGAPAPQAAPPQGVTAGTYQVPGGGLVRVGDLTPDEAAAMQADIAAGGANDNYRLPDRDVPPQGAPAPQQSATMPQAAPQAAPLPPPLNYTGGGQLQPAPPKVSPAEQARLQLAIAANARAEEAARAAAEARARGNAPAGFRFKADGSLEPIPGGPKPAGAAASEDERKAAAWLAQASNAYGNMQAALKADPNADDPGLIESYSPIDEIGNRSRSATRQQYVQAAESLSEALLRAATGAGINEHEARQKVLELTPRRGDSDAVKQQKMAAIPVYLAALKARAGRAVPQGSAPAAPTGGDFSHLWGGQ